LPDPVSTRRTEREELLELLLEHGILQRTETQPVLSRDGTSARWMLDSLAVTLTPRGAELAGCLVLERLRRFDGRQLATYGLTAVPILQSALLQAGGAYRGLLVRKESKAYGAKKTIEGAIDPDEPVVLIEDSIASGTSAGEGIAKLEDAGLRVEGCITLVRFGWEGGCSDLAERGYHVEAIYDIFEDFMSRMEGEDAPDYNPTKCFAGLRWNDCRTPEELHPAQLARAVMREFLTSGAAPPPPDSLDRTDYNSAGGAWVSVRSRDDIHERHARDGFWHLPGERSWGAPEDVVRAAWKAAAQLPKGGEGIELLEKSHVAVTFFGALERAALGELDNRRYGIVVGSAERLGVMGGALPCMPGIRDEWQQFRHARTNNARLFDYEPYSIYRHEVTKWVEPGAEWQPSGVPAANDSEQDLGVLAEHARKLVLGGETTPLPGLTLPKSVQLFVTIYLDGEVCGCMGSSIDDIAEDLQTLTRSALADDRFDRPEIEDGMPVAVSVSLLTNEFEMGDFTRTEVQSKYLHGHQALMVEQNSRAGSLLPFVTTHLSLDAEEFVDEVLDKAGITRPPYNWIRFDCSTWLADEDGVARLIGGFKRLSPTSGVGEIARLQIGYLLRNQREDGALYFGYYPFKNTLYQEIDMARLAHGAWILARAGKQQAAESALNYVLSQARDETFGLAQDAFLLLALCERGMREMSDRGAIAEKLLASLDRHGWIGTKAAVSPERASEEDEDEEVELPSADELQNYIPGQVMLALAGAAAAGIACVERRTITCSLRYYRHRFRYRRDFGQVSWLSLAAAAWWHLTGDREWSDLLFEITDWILKFQQTASSHPNCGGFLTDQQPDAPGFTTAVYLEAVAAALAVASALGDRDRERCYDRAWGLGFAFLDRLIIQERDCSVLPNAEYALGGLRENLYSGHVRIDFVQHSLAAIMTRHPDLFVAIQPDEENRNGRKEETDEKAEAWSGG
jgi:orotate phosphoribosyltransferase/AMMECR1 domain-containing protein